MNSCLEAGCEYYGGQEECDVDDDKCPLYYQPESGSDAGTDEMV